jgi:glycosyltransferase involved in cell wall biosynthesis
MVVDGVTGFLVPEHAPSVLAEALARVLGDRVFAQSLGDAGRQRAAERFSIEKNVQLLRGLFQQLDVL